MAKEYKDQILDTSVNTKRVYNIVDSDGNIVAENISFEDKTVYSQEGTEFGAKDVNEMNQKIEEALAKEVSVLDSLDEIVTNTESGKVAGALAAKEIYTSLLQSFSQAHDALVIALSSADLGVTDDMTFSEITSILSERFGGPAVGTVYNFPYSGTVQKWTCEVTGLYKLEVYGGRGGNSGGYGGYSIGYMALNKGSILYVCVGGAGTTTTGGYNGGGRGSAVGGGGATHIAKASGVLTSVSKSNVLIVAGGGGGSVNEYSGGSGGGTTGGTGSSKSGSNAEGYGGNQTTGGSSYGVTGSYGQGGGGYCGGGGGYYGGGSGADARGAAGGGSGYIGGVPSLTYAGTSYAPSTQNGKCVGNGSAKITLIKK